MSNHGGARKGAGRPRKWDFDTAMEIGQACENRWREASDTALQDRQAALPHDADIRALQKQAQLIPLARRRAWLASPQYEDHLGDFVSWLHSRAGTQPDEDAPPPPQMFRLSATPPRGARKRIIKEVAVEFELPENSVDNLWQKYRRFEQQIRKSKET